MKAEKQKKLREAVADDLKDEISTYWKSHKESIIATFIFTLLLEGMTVMFGFFLKGLPFEVLNTFVAFIIFFTISERIKNYKKEIRELEAMDSEGVY